MRWSETYKTPILDEKGQVLGTTGFARDITERKQAEEAQQALIKELEAKNAELERFTYTVSHDLKSPLVTIKGFLGWLEKDVAAGDTSRLQRDLQHIRDAANKMQALLDDLLELSRIGRLMNPPQAVPLANLVNEAVNLVAGQIEARGVQVNIAPDLPVVYGDHPRLVEALQNLLDNAIKFMGNQSQPQVSIGATNDDGETIFFIQDNGSGIALPYQQKIFGLFERLDQSVEGTGVGLALVKRIIEIHGGRIWVKSAGLGQGSTFYFTLPKPPDALV
jgi:signal transduction histidine kinase